VKRIKVVKRIKTKTGKLYGSVVRITHSSSAVFNLKYPPKFQENLEIIFCTAAKYLLLAAFYGKISATRGDKTCI